MKMSLRRPRLFLVAALISSMVFAFAEVRTVGAQEALAVDCVHDLEAYCSSVTPGDDRLVACLISYEDRIGARCRLTAYLASGKLSDRARGLKGLAKECSSDIMQYCSNLAAGGGRIVDCLKINKATLTDECRNLMK